MRAVLIVLGTIALVAVLVLGGILAGTMIARGRAAADTGGWGLLGPRMMQGQGWGMMGPTCGQSTCGGGTYGPAVMGQGLGGIPCAGVSGGPQSNQALSIAEAQTAVERYLAGAGYPDLQVKEVMEFERNFYAVVEEKDTGVGAMEMLVDKTSGAVAPEPGPNMMWNAKYGMMGRGRMGMMGGYATPGEMTLSAQEAEEFAQRWLDNNLPGRVAGEADPFYGYYTFHFLRGGQIDGMVSVHGGTGAVWYHGWHGVFVAMVEESGS